jgi:hypothetical protein
MLMAKVAFTTHPHASHGIIDTLFREEDGSDFVVELKYLTEPIGPNDKNPPPPSDPQEIAKLRKSMATLAEKALEQITKKYALTHSRGKGRLVKVGVVIARRTFVLAQCEALKREPL